MLRINLDGSIPGDNPTLAGVRSHIYSYGHRNPQGLAFSTSGRLYSSEHGPDTDDEFNLIEAGKDCHQPVDDSRWPRRHGTPRYTVRILCTGFLHPRTDYGLF